MGIVIHNKTRKRQLVQTLFDLGLSVSYDRVLEISTNMDTEVCNYYDRLNIVCPPHMKRGVFTFQHFDDLDQTTVLEPIIAVEDLADNSSVPTSRSR